MKTKLNLLSFIVMMLLMGTVYTWSVFRVEVEHIYDVSALGSGLPYMTSLFFYALSMMITGRFLSDTTMKRFVFFGGIMIAFGWLLSGLSSSLWLLIIGYGVMIGIGVGMVYGVPVYYIHRVYSRRSGLYTGLILAGFGASPLMTAPMIRIMILHLGLSAGFLIMGFISLVVMLPLSGMFSLSKHRINSKLSVNPSFDRLLFVMIYVLFLITTAIGLMMIGLSYRVGVLNYRYDPNLVALLVAAFAFLNGIARPIFGYLMDKVGFMKTATFSTTLIILAALISIFNQSQNVFIYSFSFGLFWFNLGAWLAIIPALIKAYFGEENHAKRYGIAFSAYGLGAIIGTLLSGVILDILQKTVYLYGLILILSLLMGVMIYLIKKRHLTNTSKAASV